MRTIKANLELIRERQMRWMCLDCKARFLGPMDRAPQGGCPKCASSQVLDLNVDPAPGILNVTPLRGRCEQLE